MMRKTVWIVAMISALGSSCAGKPPEVAEKPPGADLRSALDSIETEDLLKHIRALSSDEFEGRAPGTTGEEKTVNYLVEQFAAERTSIVEMQRGMFLNSAVPIVNKSPVSVS